MDIFGLAGHIYLKTPPPRRKKKQNKITVNVAGFLGNPKLYPSERFGCFTSYGALNNWFRSSVEVLKISEHSSISFRCRDPFFGSAQFHWFSVGSETCLSKVSVAADYSDSVPNSSSRVGYNGYHPLQGLKDGKRVRDYKLTSAEIARTTVENVLIAMNVSQYNNQGVATIENNIFESSSNDIPFNDDYFEVNDIHFSNSPFEWRFSDTFCWVHPVCFTKCLTKAVSMEYSKKMDHPSNGVSILGCIRPASVDEDFSLTRLPDGKDIDGYALDWKDGEILSFSFGGDANPTRLTIYTLETMSIELFSVYGVQSTINVLDFQDAEPDILVHSNQGIVDQFNKGTRYNSALRALCRKRGYKLRLLGAGLGVVLPGEFGFWNWATSQVAAERQMQQLLFPRSHRKKFQIHGNEL